MEFFMWLENSAFPSWVRESESLLAYDLYLVCHSLGMAAVVGLSVPFALRVLGFASRLPLAPLEKFFPFMYAGFWVNAASGIVLFIAYPTQAVTNPGFYIKMTGVVLAVLTLRRLKQAVFGNRAMLEKNFVAPQARVLAGALLFFWWGAILAGRLLAYHNIANIEKTASFAVTLASVLLLFVAYISMRFVRTGEAAHAKGVAAAPVRQI